MLIPILPPDGSTPATWAMIELQGEIETNLDGGVDKTEGLDVGTIELVPGTKTLRMKIGYHMLEGKSQSLKKPLVVLSKIPTAGEGDEIQYKVVGIVREKYLFKSRPRAIISKPDIK